MKRPKKSLEVILEGEKFTGPVASRVFLAVLERIGLDRVQRTHAMSITQQRPANEKFYEQIGEWWVRKHMSVDAMVGVLTRIGEELGLSITVRARDIEQELLS